MPRRVLAAAALLLVLPLLSGCFLIPSLIPPPAPNERPTSEGPEGWTEFESCPAGPRDEWVWVDGFPSEQLEAAGIEPICADTWIQEDGDHFIGVVDRGVQFEQFDALSEAMVDAGWTITYDDLVEVADDTEPGAVGWRDYELDGGETVFIIEVYYDGQGAGYTVYADHRSPGTRALAP
jgi:hypothetical protein